MSPGSDHQAGCKLCDHVLGTVRHQQMGKDMIHEECSGHIGSVALCILLSQASSRQVTDNTQIRMRHSHNEEVTLTMYSSLIRGSSYEMSEVTSAALCRVCVHLSAENKSLSRQSREAEQLQESKGRRQMRQ